MRRGTWTLLLRVLFIVSVGGEVQAGAFTRELLADLDEERGGVMGSMFAGLGTGVGVTCGMCRDVVGFGDTEFVSGVLWKLLRTTDCGSLRGAGTLRLRSSLLCAHRTVCGSIADVQIVRGYGRACVRVCSAEQPHA